MKRNVMLTRLAQDVLVGGGEGDVAIAAMAKDFIEGGTKCGRQIKCRRRQNGELAIRTSNDDRRRNLA